MLIYYLFDGSLLSATERQELIDVLEEWGFTGCRIIDFGRPLYSAYFDESFEIQKLPVPTKTIITRAS